MVQAVRERATSVALLLSLGLSVAWALIQPPVLDLAAQTFRADLWSEAGWTIWNPAWYTGHEVPGYSLLFPPLASALGLGAVGVACAVGSTAAFAALARDALGERAWLGIVWFGAASTVALWGGRLTFALGLAIGLCCLLALQRGRWGLAATLAFATSVASPVAGLFTLLAAAACGLARVAPPGGSVGAVPLRGSLAVIGGSGAGLALLALAFPTAGFQPFVFGAFVWVPLAGVAIALAAGHRRPELRWGAILYVGLGVVALVLDSPLGGNVTRLGSTFAGPVLALLLLPRRPLLLAALAVPLLFWQWTATVRDLDAARGDGSTEAAYYEPLLEQLEGRVGSDVVRVHIPPTRNRWEAAYVAPEHPLLFGWLRQLESAEFDFLEQDEIEPGPYRRWLRERGVGLVAVPDAEPDRLAVTEREAIAAGALGPPVWSGGGWELYEADGSLVDGAGEITALAPDRVEVRVRGEVILRLGYSPYLRVAEGAGCIQPVDGPGDLDWIRLRPASPGSQVIRFEARLRPEPLWGDDGSCEG